MSKASLLINESPLMLLPSLAKLIGLNEAVVTQQLHYYLTTPRGGVMRDGHRWIYNTYAQWQEECFCFWSIDTIKRVFLRLEEMHIVVSCQPDGRESRMKYYRLNKGMLEKLTFENLPDKGNLPPSDYEQGKLPPSDEGKLPLWEQGKLPPSLKTKNHKESTEIPPKPPEASASPSLFPDEMSSSIISKIEKTSKVPTHWLSIAIANLYSRRLTTEWSEKELKAYKKLKSFTPEDMDTIKGYYEAERAKKKHYLRKDLLTFLNNFPGELDRANEWKTKFRVEPPKDNGPKYAF